MMTINTDTIVVIELKLKYFVHYCQAQKYIIDEYSEFIYESDGYLSDRDEQMIRDKDYEKIKEIITKNFFKLKPSEKFKKLMKYTEGEYVEKGIDHELKKITI